MFYNGEMEDPNEPSFTPQLSISEILADRAELARLDREHFGPQPVPTDPRVFKGSPAEFFNKAARDLVEHSDELVRQAVADNGHAWLVCPTCEISRPFRIDQSELGDADGFITCEFCEAHCVLSNKWIRSK